MTAHHSAVTESIIREQMSTGHMPSASSAKQRLSFTLSTPDSAGDGNDEKLHKSIAISMKKDSVERCPLYPSDS
ncbi:hypothetical protein N027_17920 [Pseudomonas syringae USA007]|uniref:Uncharacterized protein n=1 Tax=Pseudomonas syringae USA007 TaxID=1357288 RepID=A0AAU8M4A4_PSESX|nr:MULTISPECIES: hypothetical protein [Pseudomonas syringae group]